MGKEGALMATGRKGADKNGAAWGDEIFDVFQQADISQVAYVPDAGHTRLIERCIADNQIQAVALTTEEEGVALLAGAWAAVLARYSSEDDVLFGVGVGTGKRRATEAAETLEGLHEGVARDLGPRRFRGLDEEHGPGPGEEAGAPPPHCGSCRAASGSPLRRRW